MDQRKQKLLGGGLLLTAGILLSKETFAWLLGRALDFVTSLFSRGGNNVTQTVELPWLDLVGLALFVAGAILLVVNFRRSPLPTAEQLAARTPLIEFGAQLHALEKADPWLGFWGTGYNGSEHPIAIKGVSGRVRINGEDLAGQMEVTSVMDANRDDATEIAPHSFFIFGLELRLSKAAAVALVPIRQDSFSVLFTNAKLEAIVIAKHGEQPFSIAIPRKLSFNAKGQPEPTFFNQVHSS